MRKLPTLVNSREGAEVRRAILKRQLLQDLVIGCMTVKRGGYRVSN